MIRRRTPEPAGPVLPERPLRPSHLPKGPQAMNLNDLLHAALGKTPPPEPEAVEEPPPGFPDLGQGQRGPAPAPPRRKDPLRAAYEQKKYGQVSSVE